MKKLSAMLVAFILVAATAFTAFAAGINDSEQAVLNELKTSVKMNGSEMVIPSEFVNQAENYFNTIDMTADESSQIVAVLKKGESFLENSGASNIADLTFAQKQTLLSYGKEVVGVLDMTMSYDTSSKKLTIYGKDGKVAFSAVPTLTKAGSVQDNSVIKTTGAGLAPFDCWLVLRGMKTLGIRMERSQENAEQIAAWLQQQKAVTRVIYPGLPDHPGHEIMKKQARGFGAMLTIQLESKEFALAILEKVRMIRFAESLGGVETLVTYPTTQTHADVPKEIRERNGITESTLRFSVGIENIEDLIGELEKVFAEIEEEKNDGKKS